MTCVLKMGSPHVEKSEETNRQIDSNTKSNSKEQNEEKANEHPEWLPEGWNVEVRIRKSGAHMGAGYKCYSDPLKGYKFFSKPEVLRYLETLKDNSGTSKKGKKLSNMHSPNENGCTSKKEKKCSNMHSPKDNSCTSKKDKICSNLDSPNDNSFTSKKEKKVDSPNNNSFTSKKEKKCNNMDSLNDNSCTPKNEKKCINMDSLNDNSCTPKETKCSNMDSPTDVVVEKYTVEDLPPGWIKELKIRKNGNSIRKDPFYIDPVNGYVFRSKKDVMRFLESGDIYSCAFKPSRRQIQDEDNISPPPASKRQKLKQPAPRQQLSAATEILDKSSLELPDANSSRKRQNTNVPSGMTVTSVPVVESVVKMHSLENGAANSPEIKKSSDPGSSALLKNESLKKSEEALSADDVQEKEHVVNMMENANEKNHNNHSMSKKRKEFNVPHRSSPRLAGNKPVHSANNVINEQTLQVPKRNLRKSRNTLDIDISEDQAVSKEQPHQQESDKIEDNKPEIQISSNKSSNKKEHHLPRRASKRLAGIEHESMKSISCEEAPNYRSKKSKDEVKAELQQSEDGPVTVVTDHAPTKGKSANKRRKSEPQLEKLENEVTDDEKSEPQLSFAFHYSWSDPNLESAISTLTGVLPPVDNISTSFPETDIQKTLVDNVTGQSTTTVPETDIQKALVDNVTGQSTTIVPETDTKNTLADSVTGRSTTTVPETDIQKALADNVMGRSTTTVSDTDIQKTLVDNVTGQSTTTVPETDIQKALVDNVTGQSTTIVPETDTKNTLAENVTGRSTTTVPETDIQKALADNVMGRSTTTVSDTDIQKTLVDNVTGRNTTIVPETDIQKTLIDNVTGRNTDSENNLLDTVTGSRDRNSQVRSNKPKRKKELKVPMRLSKRLAGLEPEVLPAERALEYSTRKSCKEEPTATDTSTNAVSDHHNATDISTNAVSDHHNATDTSTNAVSDHHNATDTSTNAVSDHHYATDTSTNAVSDHHNAGEEIKLTLQASDSLTTEVLGESLKQSVKSYDAQTGQKEQIQKVEDENIVDERSQPQLPLPFGDSWSDPCLEFAIKTLTGALPVDAGADIMPDLPPGFDNPPYKQSCGSVVTSINQEAHDNSNQSQNKKELNMVSQPELRTSSTSCENAPKFTTREPYVDQGNIIRNLHGEPCHNGNTTQPVHHSRNINTPTHEEPLKQNAQIIDGGFVTTEQQLFETGTVNHDNSELQYCTSFMNSWSDPCLEFAFKTLTGVLPVEENLTLQGCFQEPANYDERRDGGSVLPDFGSSSFSQSDFSFLQDTGVKSMPGQQSSMSSSFLPLEKTTLQGFAGVDPQTQFSQGNNDFQRR